MLPSSTSFDEDSAVQDRDGSESPPGKERRSLLLDGAAIALVHAVVCALARKAGFDHVSDDDFARVTIAELFAHAPKLDPSGTSWLPLPFWALGGTMAVFGRSLPVARIASVAFSSLAATAPYFALRIAGTPRARALLAIVFAFASPWFVWVGATTVPESFTASFAVAGAIGLARLALGGDTRRTRAPLYAIAIAAACLSRYEPWPMAATVAIALGVAAARRGRGRDRTHLVLLAIACAAAPLLWMGWNAHVHDGPLHFWRRVAGFKRAIGEGSSDTLGALALYPLLLFSTRPEVVVPALFLLPSLRERSVRRRWGIPLLAAAAQVLFLAFGNARDGAPAHHPERAVLASLLLLGLFVADVGLTKLADIAVGGRVLAARAATAVFATAWVVSTMRGVEPPGEGPTEDRREAIRRGEELRANGAPPITLTPCAYEHFALLAAYGAPERAEIVVRPAGMRDETCPVVQLR